MGVGAFNMIRAEAYWELGGHAAFKMHPIDDIMLGKRVKQQGFTQDCLQGGDFVQVRWYENLSELVSGLMKNIFALYSYRIDYVAAAVFGIVLFTIVPLWGLLIPQEMVKMFSAASILCRCAVFICNSRRLNVPPAAALWCLVTPYLTVYIVIRAVWTTLRKQGIVWRGTHYPLEELKKEDPLLTF